VTPQSQFLVIAPIAEGREDGLRALLESMNAAPGEADPDNGLIPFGRFEGLHFARLTVIGDAHRADLRVYGVEPQPMAPRLAFLGECDGPWQGMLAELAARAGAGLARLFGHCRGFDPDGDPLAWMLAHQVPSAACYVNWVGRTVRQVREEQALRLALSARVPRGGPATGADAQRIRRELIDYGRAQLRAGRLSISAPPPTPLAWRLSNLLHAIGVPLIGLAALPLLVAALPFVALGLRRLERSDPEVCPPPDPRAVAQLRRIEDWDLTNQFTAIGPVKPGGLRRALVTVLLVLIDYGCRHLYNRGHLARVQTIHFARWAVLEGGTEVLFASNYDGGHEAYMDDFINKVAWGLNLIFSNGIGWPRTDWLMKGGARQEQCFKRYQRGHQIPTQVWYKAYPGLALCDLERNRRIRAGFEQAEASPAEALAWLRLL
jgi:hypothetical protein